MNYLDYLTNQDPLVAPMQPRNYVDFPIQAADPTVAAQPAQTAADPSFMERFQAAREKFASERGEIGAGANLTEMLTPVPKPLVGGDFAAVKNPFAAAPQKSGIDFLSLISEAQAKGSSGGSIEEAQKAIDMARRGTGEFKKSTKPRINLNEFEQPIAGLSQSVQDLEEAASESEVRRATNEQAALAENARLQEEYAKVQDESMARINELQDGISKIVEEKVDTQIDPGRFWSNLSTGRKIGLGISMIFASITPESTKQAIDAVNRAVTNDIDAQKFDINQQMQLRKEGSDTQFKILDAAFKLTGNRQAAIATLMAKNFEQARFQIEQMESKVNNKQSLVNAQQAKSVMAMQATKYKQDAINASIDQTNQLAQNVMASRLSEAQLQMQKAGMQQQLDLSQKTGMGFANYNDPIATQIMLMVPENFRQKAIEERGAIDAAEAMVQGVDEYFERYEQIFSNPLARVQAKIPFTEEANFIDKAGSIIWGPAAAIAQSAISKDAAQKLIKPYIPHPFLSSKAVKENKNILKQTLVNTMMGHTPTLKHFGVDTLKHYPRIQEVLNPAPKKK